MPRTVCVGRHGQGWRHDEVKDEFKWRLVLTCERWADYLVRHDGDLCLSASRQTARDWLGNARPIKTRSEKSPSHCQAIVAPCNFCDELKAHHSSRPFFPGPRGAISRA